jgi:hypothetical protein
MQTAEMMEMMSLNPDILGFLESIARRNTVQNGTQTEDAGTGASKEHARTSRHAWPHPHTVRGFTRNLTPNHAAAVLDLYVYMPWTGMILELLPTNKELHENDSVFTSTQSQGELQKMLCEVARPHLNTLCFQAYITDVRMEIQHGDDFSNRCTVSYTPFYKVWLPVCGSLFEISGNSLPSPVKNKDRSNWSHGELFAMESCAIGQVALEDFLLGDSLVEEDYTWIPVLQKSCRGQVRMDNAGLEVPQEYPPASLATSSPLPNDWQNVVALPHASQTPSLQAYQGAAASFPHVGTLAAAQKCAFSPVLFTDVIPESPQDNVESHQSAYRATCDAFLACMKPVCQLVASGKDPLAHGWRRSTRAMNNEDVHVWERGDATLGKRRAEGDRPAR